MSQANPSHSCRMCGSTSYRPVIARDEAGVMRATALFRCSGCSVVFADPQAWREGGSNAAAPLHKPTVRIQPEINAPTQHFSPRSPDLSTYGAGPGPRNRPT